MDLSDELTTIHIAPKFFMGPHIFFWAPTIFMGPLKNGPGCAPIIFLGPIIFMGSYNFY